MIYILYKHITTPLQTSIDASTKRAAYVLRHAGGIGMNIIISNSSDKPIYEQITIQIKTMVMNGMLKEGDLLPSMRTLAKELRISVITTKRAYEDLEKDGFITTVVGKGSFVKAADTRLVREEKLKEIEELLSRAVSIAQQSNITRQEVEEMIEILYQEEV